MQNTRTGPLYPQRWWMEQLGKQNLKDQSMDKILNRPVSGRSAQIFLIEVGKGD